MDILAPVRNPLRTTKATAVRGRVELADWRVALVPARDLRGVELEPHAVLGARAAVRATRPSGFAKATTAWSRLCTPRIKLYKSEARLALERACGALRSAAARRRWSRIGSTLGESCEFRAKFGYGQFGPSLVESKTILGDSGDWTS